MQKKAGPHVPSGCNRSAIIGIPFLIVLLVSMLLATGAACSRPKTVEIIPTEIESVETVSTVTESVKTVPTSTESHEKFSAGDHALTMVYDDIERSYVLHIPPGWDESQPVPLVLAFHSIGLNADEMIRISGFNAQSDASGFIVVYPEGIGDAKSWNGGHCCGEAAKNNVDDVGFVRALIGELSTSILIDQNQIHATGFSNGAIFTYRLACELSDLIASFGPISATPMQEDIQTCAPGRPVPIMHFHGTADDPNPYIKIVLAQVITITHW